jgi:LAO/AO transport system kinase
MRSLSGDEGIFIRSMATRGSLGGLSQATSDVVTVLDAAGFDRIVVETVGTGQTEVEIASTAHTTLIVEAPGLGDEVQAIKAGILEVGDVLVVNKADLPGADRTARALEMMLELGDNDRRQVRHHSHLFRVDTPPERLDARQEGWTPRVLKTVAAHGEGVDELQHCIERHRQWLLDSGEIEVRERLRIAFILENIIRATLNRRIAITTPQARLYGMVEMIRQRKTDPYVAACSLLADL